MATNAADLQPAPLSAAERATLGALLERMFPADELGPGALEIGVLDYVERALAGPYAGQLPAYQAALAGLDHAAVQPFASLPADRQDALIDRLERRDIPQIEQSAAGFFETVWQHLREGLFADPIHGGNRAMAGWRLIGFPGAQTGYSAAEQELDVIITKAPQSVMDLYPDSQA
jgi:gluconate 2-dehydrogenase alpha chain